MNDAAIYMCALLFVNAPVFIALLCWWATIKIDERSYSRSLERRTGGKFSAKYNRWLTREEYEFTKEHS